MVGGLMTAIKPRRVIVTCGKGKRCQAGTQVAKLTSPRDGGLYPAFLVMRIQRLAGTPAQALVAFT